MCAHEFARQSSLTDRRSFLKWVAAGSAAGMVAPRASRGAVPAGRESPVTALGMLGARLGLSGRRLTGTGTPAYTPSFVLADVSLSPGRRFTEFSGDLSGRYIEALSVAPHGADRLPALVGDLVANQRPDGRFGDAALVFSADAIGPAHMALLWGNGRLLVGLVAYWDHHKDPLVLASARRLADFLVGVRRQCADPSVARRVEGMGAVGIICFTQLVEGLVMTASATGDTRYLETAAGIAPTLPPRGIQHSHGYLSTLRGVVLLHEATRDRRWLDFVVERYADLVASRDCTVYGAVLEYFGWDTPGVTAAERQHLLDLSGQHPRDEGCSSADFVRLSLQLWRVTGDLDYLERAERALENSLYPNQWETGDFGSRVTFEQGLMPTQSTARCWWCCTMHGHRALADVLAASVLRRSGQLTITLLGDARWSDGTAEIGVSREITTKGLVSWHVDADGLEPGESLLVREPRWADSVRVVAAGGGPLAGAADAGFRTLGADARGRLSFGVEAAPGIRVRSRSGELVALPALTATPAEGALFCGPWLLAADEGREPLFFGEPWQENVVSLATRPPISATIGQPASAPRLALRASYEHGGFPGTQPVTLTPLSTLSEGPQRTMAVWLKYRKA